MKKQIRRNCGSAAKKTVSAAKCQEQHNAGCQGGNRPNDPECPKNDGEKDQEQKADGAQDNEKICAQLPANHSFGLYAAYAAHYSIRWFDAFRSLTDRQTRDTLEGKEGCL